MAGTNWSFAALSKGERLDKIRNGDQDVYAQEKSRINTLIDSYKELGLDTSEQEAWARSLDMAATNNYGRGGSVSAEEKAYNDARLGSGEITSYTSIYPSSKTAQERVSGTSQPSQTYSGTGGYGAEKSAALSQAKGLLESAYTARSSALEDYYGALNSKADSEYSGKKQEAYAYAMQRLPAIREGLANAGLHSEGGTSRSEQLKYQAGLDGALSALDKQRAEVISGNNRAKESESAGLYSSYVDALSKEQARLDDYYYKIERDAADDAFRKAQMAQQQAQYERDAQSSDARTAAQYTQWEKEYDLKSDAQRFSQDRSTALDKSEQERFEREYALKLRQADEALSQWEKEFGFKQSQAERSELESDRDYEYRQSQLEAQREQALREYALRKMAQDQSATQAQRNYALMLLENSQSYEKWQTEQELKRAAAAQSAASQSPMAQPASAQPGTSKDKTSQAAQPSKAEDKSETKTDTPSARTETYNTFMDTARWMRNAVSGKDSVRQFTDNQIEDWVSSLPISSRQKKDIMEALGLGG